MKNFSILAFFTVCSLGYSQAITIDIVDTIYLEKVDAKQLITIHADGRLDTLSNLDDVYEMDLDKIPDRIISQYLDQISKNFKIVYYSLIDQRLKIGVIPKQIF